MSNLIEANVGDIISITRVSPTYSICHVEDFVVVHNNQKHELFQLYFSSIKITDNIAENKNEYYKYLGWYGNLNIVNEVVEITHEALSKIIAVEYTLSFFNPITAEQYLRTVAKSFHNNEDDVALIFASFKPLAIGH